MANGIVQILGHGSTGWWDEVLLFAVPIVIAVLVVGWIALRSRAGSSDED